ncbi:MAG TPA: uroporphyrinogen-III decarboxylase-like protein [Lentisphaeria bacterium]|nr:MAG: hypothetical protein A2X48_24290 [Lentisphaerae bacterium GWF2_49_21]HBC86858.1 uroporphyrinogen-III decarboxylase-like protein [Lentisphaeria bacterium]
MNSRERILAAINHQPVDRIPTDIWATPEVTQKLKEHFGEGVDYFSKLHIDGMSGVGPDYIGPALPVMPEGEGIDIWGMKTRKAEHAGGTYNEQCFYPLSEATCMDDIVKYKWPSADWFDYSKMKEKAKELRKTKVVTCGYMAPFYFHNKLRGLEQSFVDLMAEQELAHEIIRRVSDFFYEHHKKMFEACDGLIDISQVTDDLGSQTGPMISLDTYTEFYAPQHRRLIKLCKDYGIKVFHHDDGSNRIFLPMLVEMGIDILNPVQWTCPDMDMVGLKKEFGKKVCFHGAVENQRILPFGTPEEVRAEVRHCIDSLAGDKTGYILAPCHNLQGITPVENILAMYDEAWNYGKMK